MVPEIRQQDGVTILEPSGKIVGPAVSELRKVILPQVEVSEAPRILINFEHVTMIDSSGLGTLMEARTLASRKKGRIGVTGVGRHVRNLMVLGRIVSLFEHFDSEADGISGLST